VLVVAGSAIMVALYAARAWAHLLVAVIAPIPVIFKLLDESYYRLSGQSLPPHSGRNELTLSGSP
jgi:hypothetical protein